MIPKLLIDIAIPLEVRSGRSPRRRVRAGRKRVSGDCVAREEPDFNEVGIPFHGVDAAGVAVETGAVGGSAHVVDRAAGV